MIPRLPEEQKRRGIIACTTGNHGQSLAYACRLFGVPCRLVVPARSNPDKVAAMRALGAELIEHGRDYDEAREHCEAIRQREDLRYVHSANEPAFIAGVGTYALEIFDELPDPDVILVPVGLGSGICGLGLVAAERRPQTRIIGVQSSDSDAMARSPPPCHNASANAGPIRIPCGLVATAIPTSTPAQNGRPKYASAMPAIAGRK